MSEAPTFMEWSTMVVPTCPEGGSHALQVCQTRRKHDEKSPMRHVDRCAMETHRQATMYFIQH